eukprot:scaffold225876_cov39-Tisochrysis_lutea.AAC.2
MREEIDTRVGTEISYGDIVRGDEWSIAQTEFAKSLNFAVCGWARHSPSGGLESIPTREARQAASFWASRGKWRSRRRARHHVRDGRVGESVDTFGVAGVVERAEMGDGVAVVVAQGA